MIEGAAEIAESIASQRLKAVVFDMDGTLYASSAGVEQQIRPAMVATASQVLHIGIEESKKLLRKYRSEYKSSVLGLERYHGVDPFSFYVEVYSKIDIAKMQPYEGLSSALHDLSKICPLFVLTNSNSSFADRVLSRLGILPIFESIYTVEDNNFIRKPNRVVYESLFSDKLKMKPDEVVIFDDIASSQEVASSMNCMTVLVGNGLRPEPEFVDLHTGKEYLRKPDYVDYSTHNISLFLKAILTSMAV